MLREAVENRILSEVEEQMRSLFQDPLVDPVHDYPSHILVVVNNAREISIGEHQDPFVPTLSAWLHDGGRIAEIKARQEGRNLPHAQASAELVPVILAPYKDYLDGQTMLTIQDAVARHSGLNQADDSTAAIFLKEADRLAGLGAVGIFRNIAESGLKNRHLINLGNPFPNDPIQPSRFREADASGTEALLFISEWHEMFRTRTGQKLSEPHAGIMARYLWQIANETGTQTKCANNRLIREVLSVHAPDIHPTIKSFFFG